MNAPVSEIPRQGQKQVDVMAPPKRLAFIVGCDHYDSSAIPNLNFAVNDAKAFYDILIDPEIGNYRPEDEAFLIQNPTSTAVSFRILNCLRNLRPNDAILIYYSGHGLKNESGELYLATTDTDPEGALDVGTLPSRLLHNYLKKSRSKQICMILDCCYSGAFGFKEVVSREEFEEDIKSNLSLEGNVILMSASHTQRSKEDDDIGHGIYTHYLIEGLKSGAADRDADGLITPNELHSYIKDRMVQEGRTDQKPKIIVSGAGGDFALFVSKKKRAQWKQAIDVHVEECIARKNHLAAMEYLSNKRKEARGIVEEKDLEKIIAKVTEDKLQLVNEFKQTILNAQSEGQLQDSLVSEVIACINKRPDFLFQYENQNECEELLQECFRGNLKLSFLSKKWTDYVGQLDKDKNDSKSVATKISDADILVAETEPEDTKTNTGKTAQYLTSIHEYWRANLSLRVTMLLIVIVVAVVVTFNKFSEPPYDKSSMRVGVLMKGDNTFDGTTKAFSILFTKINKILQYKSKNQQSLYQFDSDSIVVLHSPAELAVEIKKGELDLVGELSPFLVYKMGKKFGMKPIISPVYGNKYYSSIIFARSDSDIFKTNNPFAALIDTLQIGNGRKRIVVTGDENTSTSDSTSGFWYPRKEILKKLDDKYSFLDIAKLVNKKEIISRVCKGGDIVAGALANFRFSAYSENNNGAEQKFCDNKIALKQVIEVDFIPQGAYMVRKELYADLLDENVLDDLNDAWEKGVESLYINEKSSELLNAHNIGKQWYKVEKDQSYYAKSQKVFGIVDKKIENINNKQRLSLFIAFIILVIGAVVYFYIKQPDADAKSA